MQKRNAIMHRVREAVRHPYAWPGGYPVYVVLADGETLCAQCVRENYRAISQSTRRGDRDGWAAAGADIFYEGREYCAHCSKELETAYGDPDESSTVETHTAPSAWASYLINGDDSGIDAADKAAADAWLESLNLGAPVDCTDAGFMGHHDAYNVCPLAADCQSYAFHTKESDT